MGRIHNVARLIGVIAWIVVGTEIWFDAFGVRAVRYNYDSWMVECTGSMYEDAQAALEAFVDSDMPFNVIVVYGGATLVVDDEDGSQQRYYFYLKRTGPAHR